MSKKTKVQTVDLGKKGSFKVRKGALHKALGVPEDEAIGQERIRKAMNSKNPEIRKMAESAAGLTSMKKS
jgi:hypothetical protein